MAKPLDKRLNIRDADGSLTAGARDVAQRMSGQASAAAGVRLAVTYTQAALRAEKAPLDWAACEIEDLRTLAVHGYDYLTRQQALAEIEKRLALPCGCTATDVCSEHATDRAFLAVLVPLFNALDEEERSKTEPHQGFEAMGRVAVSALVKAREEFAISGRFNLDAYRALSKVLGGA